jgi:hypothetical protein
VSGVGRGEILHVSGCRRASFGRGAWARVPLSWKVRLTLRIVLMNSNPSSCPRGMRSMRYMYPSPSVSVLLSNDNGSEQTPLWPGSKTPSCDATATTHGQVYSPTRRSLRSLPPPASCSAGTSANSYSSPSLALAALRGPSSPRAAAFPTLPVRLPRLPRGRSAVRAKEQCKRTMSVSAICLCGVRQLGWRLERQQGGMEEGGLHG